MSHYVYILQSLKDGGYYVGETADVEARLRFHNAGLQRSTRSRRPFKIILIETFADRSAALKREKEIKSWKGGNKFKKLIEGSSPAQRGTTFGT
ncbi:MAG: GIY-YIG nuclease family protein [Chitinophagaceae bacterium]|nr:GIY-YIG nuclease family protein [Chitinophagaceae bacterium]